LDRLHEEVSGQSIKRTTFRKYQSDWLTAKKTEIASSTMDFYQASLKKFQHFLGQRADEPIGEITKEDVVAFRNSLVNQVSAKTVNHDLKTLKMLFKSVRRDSVVTEDPTEFVETVRNERRAKIKRPFTLLELRSVLDLPSNDWRSMIVFGLYTGQRLADVATLRWNNLDLVRGGLRLSTRKIDKTMVLPLAAPLRKHLEFLSLSSKEASAPIHPKAFDFVERQHKTGSLSNQFRRPSSRCRAEGKEEPQKQRQRSRNEERGTAVVVSQPAEDRDHTFARSRRSCGRGPGSDWT
jgi:integrase